MRVSLFVEHPVPRPWSATSEQRVFSESLEQLALADQVGFHGVWVTEHHFQEEYSHSSAPEMFLAALSQRTTNLRLGHGIVHMPPAINHPARVAERIAALDLLSNGRVEFGTGEASSMAELGGFNFDPGLKRPMWREGLEVAIEDRDAGCAARLDGFGCAEHEVSHAEEVVEGQLCRVTPRHDA